MVQEGSIISLPKRGPGGGGEQLLILRILGEEPGAGTRLIVAPLHNGETGASRWDVTITQDSGAMTVALDKIRSLSTTGPLTVIGALAADDQRQVSKAVHAMLFVPQAKGDWLPFARHAVGADEAAEVMDTLASDWLTTGPKTQRFEKEFSDFVGARHSIAVNSATSGLHLALEAMGVGPGDHVITTTNTFTATAEVVRYLGAEVVFADIDPQTLNICPKSVEAALEKHVRTVKVIMPVHFAGQACDMDPLTELARAADAKILEDAAHALPATYKGRMVGTLGDAAAFSFYATKTIATGEGGMVVTDDNAMAKRIRTMRLHGIDRDAFDRYQSDKPSWYYEIVAPGFKYNMTDIAASFGIHQLARAAELHCARESIAARYNEAFADLPLQAPQVTRPDDKHAHHLYVVQLDLERLNIDRDRFMDAMTGAGIGTSVHFIPLHLQPYWRDRYQLRPEDFPAATAAFQRSVSLPIFSTMSDDEVDRVIDAVRDALKQGRN